MDEKELQETAEQIAKRGAEGSTAAPPKKRGRPTKEEALAKKKALESARKSAAKKNKKSNRRKVITTRDLLAANIAKTAKRDGRLVEELSPREKAAVIYGLLYNPDATQIALWEIAVDYKSDGATETTRKAYASRWFNSAPIVIFRNQFMAQYEKDMKQKIDAALSVQKEQLMLKFGQIDPDDIDYTKPDAQRKLLNHIINSSDESKEKLDALKAVISMQKDDREAARDNKIQRFYMPLKCMECPLHARAEKSRERRLREKAALEEAKKNAEEAAKETGEEIDESKYELVETDDDDIDEEFDQQFRYDVPDTQRPGEEEMLE